MEKISNVSIISRDYLYSLINVLVTSDFDDRLRLLISKIIDTDFIDIALASKELTVYRALLYNIIELKLKGYDTASIVERLSHNKEFQTILTKALSLEKINKNSILDILQTKLKVLSLYNFFIRFTKVVNPATMNELAEEQNFRQVITSISELYRDITFDIVCKQRTYTDVNELEHRFSERLLRLTNKASIKIVPTGIPYVDICMRYGGFESQGLYMIGATYGTGKTRFITKIASNMYLQGFNVYHVTIENRIEDIEELYDTALLGLSPEQLNRIIRNSLNDSTTLDEIKKRLREIYTSRQNAIYIKKFHPYHVDAFAIKEWILQMRQSGANPPDVVIVDHIDIVSPSDMRKADSLFQRGEQVASELKTIAEELNVVLIVPTQLSREARKEMRKGHESGGETTSRSIAKLELVDFYMTLNQTEQEAMLGYMRLFIDKNRFGIDQVTIPIFFNKATLELRVIDSEDELVHFSQKVRISVERLKKRLSGDAYDSFFVNLTPRLISSDTQVEHDYESVKEFIDKVTSVTTYDYDFYIMDDTLVFDSGDIIYFVKVDDISSYLASLQQNDPETFSRLVESEPKIREIIYMLQEV